MKLRILKEEDEEKKIILPQSVKTDMALQQEKEQKEQEAARKAEQEVEQKKRNALKVISDKIENDSSYANTPEAIEDVKLFLRQCGIQG